jgi:DNA-binding MarR family transcriptional regulator
MRIVEKKIMNKINFTTIDHNARKELGISMNEYALADLIYKYSNDSKGKLQEWCCVSKNVLAKNLDLSERTILRIIESLREKNLLNKDPQTNCLAITELWYEVVVEHIS